jgi:NAD(P)-dependent dehydrogenase (short-subunit alcohol dehydrogenase family)
MMDLTDKVVLVSGGARGIGEAVARAIVAAGRKVVIGDVLDEGGGSLARHALEAHAGSSRSASHSQVPTSQAGHR